MSSLLELTLIFLLGVFCSVLGNFLKDIVVKRNNRDITIKLEEGEEYTLRDSIEEEDKILGILLSQDSKEALARGICNERTIINNVVNDELSKLEGMFDRNHITVNINFPSKLLEGNIDLRVAGIIIRNLLHNAAQYSFFESVVNVTGNSENKRIWLSISNKTQLSTSEIDHISKKYYRGENSCNQPGLGLGLYISKKLAKKYDSNISLSYEDSLFIAVLDVPEYQTKLSTESGV